MESLPAGKAGKSPRKFSNLPDNLFPKALTKKLQEDFNKGFINSGEYVGNMSVE